MRDLSNQYVPDYAFPPGETIKEMMESLGLGAAELGQRLRVSPAVVEGLLCGRETITAEIATGLEEVVQVPASFWLNLERNYRQTLARLEQGRD